MRPPGNPFGSIPGPVTTPQPFSDLSKIYPNLSGTNALASGDLMSELNGELSPATQQAIRQASAQFGVTSGMPGSGLMNNRTVRDLGLTTQGLVNQGIQNYGALINPISNTQTVRPELQAEIGATNSVNASSPNPADAATYARTLFDKYLASMRSPAGGTGPNSSVPWWQQGNAASQNAGLTETHIPYMYGL